MFLHVSNQQESAYYYIGFYLVSMKICVQIFVAELIIVQDIGAVLILFT